MAFSILVVSLDLAGVDLRKSCFVLLPFCLEIPPLLKSQTDAATNSGILRLGKNAQFSATDAWLFARKYHEKDNLGGRGDYDE